jgi:hypothetical protein
VDGCLQLAGLWSEKALGGATLPMSIGEFVLHTETPPAGQCSAVVRAGKVHESHAECDVSLVDADGTVRAELSRVTSVRRPR